MDGLCGQGEALFLSVSLRAESAEPLNLRLTPEPGQLPLGVITVRLLRSGNSFRQSKCATQVLQRLTISQRIQWTHGTVAPQESCGFFNQASLEHLFCAQIDALVQCFTIRVESQA